MGLRYFCEAVQPCAEAITCMQAAFAGADSWTEYFQLFRESRFVHVTSLDFTALCLFSPFWMWNDADKRQWEGR